MTITPHQLKLFVAVAKNLNMTRTSREIHVTESAISHQLKQLQREIERTLIRSNGRGIELTTDGVNFLRKAEVVLGNVDELYRKNDAKTRYAKKS